MGWDKAKPLNREWSHLHGFYELKTRLQIWVNLCETGLFTVFCLVRPKTKLYRINTDDISVTKRLVWKIFFLKKYGVEI